MNRPIPATLGGFSIGFATGILAGVLPADKGQYLQSFIFAAVIVVLLVRPNGLFTRAGGAVERV
jgi:branched-chain amino acid transport system permease protein